MAINFNKVEFILSAASEKQFVRDGMPQLAFAGRSNVGKSSVINRLVNRKNFARVGASPGKTSQINYFKIAGKLYLVDLPGYGYAKVSKTERDRWGKLMESYFQSAGLIHLGVQIVDARHKPTADDVTMHDYFVQTGCPVVIVANKLDKLKAREIEPNLAQIRETLSLRDDELVIPFSAEKGTGKPKRARVNRDVPHSFLPVLMVAMVFVGCASVGGNGYLGVLFTSEGFSTEAAAALIAVSGACLMVSKLFNGVIFDAIGTRNGSVLFFLLFIGGTGLLCLSDMGSSWLATAAAVMFGLGLSLGTVGISVWSIELAPKGREVQTIRNFQICYALGGFIFMLLPGFLAEAFGTYLVSYAALFFMLIAAAAVIVGLYTICDLKAARNGKDR